MGAKNYSTQNDNENEQSENNYNGKKIIRMIAKEAPKIEI